MSEEEFYNNLINNYEKASKNKIYIEGVRGGNVDMKVNENQSIYVWKCKNLVLTLDGKCNHVFLYKSEKVTLRIENCVSGITCMGSKNCGILITVIPEYNIEISNSDKIDIRSAFFSTPIMFKGVDMNVIKSMNCEVSEYYNVNDGMLGYWNLNFFNF